MQAAEALGATVVNMRFVKPIDDEMIARMADSHELLVSVEEHVVMGGAGSAVAESLQAQGIVCPLLQIGLPDYNIDHGEQGELLAQAGLDAAGIQRQIEDRVEQSTQRSAPGTNETDPVSGPRLVSRRA